MDSIEKLAKLFSDFPGIGPRQSRRFVYFLLTKDKKYLEELSETVKELKKEIKSCNSCRKFFQGKGELCRICSAGGRDVSLLMIVEKDADLENIERVGVYKGLYFVLGGKVPILNKKPKENVRTDYLLDIVNERLQNNVLKEVVIATSANPDGENTAKHIIEEFEPLKEKYDFKVSVLGRGLSTGTELEYSDKDTIKNALQNRSSGL